MTETNHVRAHDSIQSNVDLTYQNVNIVGIHWESEDAPFICSHFRNVFSGTKGC